MSSQDFERTLREWLRQGQSADAGGDPQQLWRQGRRRRTRRVLVGSVAGAGLVAAAAAGVLAVGGGLLPEATDTGPAAPTVTAPAPTTSAPQQEQETAAPTAAEETGEEGWGQPLVECSTGAYSADADDLDTEGLPGPVAQKAEQLLTAAMTCDEQALVTTAEADGTVLSYGGLSAQEALGIPQEDPRYLKLAVLLAATGWAVTEDGGERLYVWPAAFAPEAADEDWQDVRHAGLHEPGLLAEMQRSGSYTGWRTGLTEDGDWRFLVAGD